MLRALQLDFPSAAWLLFVVIGIAWLFFFLFHYRQKKLQSFAERSVLDSIVEKREPVIFWIKVILYGTAWICAVMALMGPKGNERYVSTSPDGQVAIVKKSALEKTVLRKNTHEVIFLVDASASMNIADLSGRTRLEVAKEIVDDVIHHLKGENVSLFAFTSATTQIVPSTLDYLFTRLMLQQIKINEEETEGTDIKQALEALRKQFFAKASPKNKTLIVLSDGGDTSLVGLNAEERKQAIAKIISPIADAGEKKLHVFAVGLGSSEGKEVPDVLFHGRSVTSAVDEPLLRRLSLSGNLFVATKMAPFHISEALNQNIAREESFVDTSVDLSLPDSGNGTHIYDFYFQYPLSAAIIALMGCLQILVRELSIGGTRETQFSRIFSFLSVSFFSASTSAR